MREERPPERSIYILSLFAVKTHTHTKSGIIIYHCAS